MKTHWEAPPFFTSIQAGSESSILRPGEKAPSRPIHWIGGWVTPKVYLDAVEKSKISCPEREPKSCRPARRYTDDWAIPVPSHIPFPRSE
jgi:hypothetical protein